MDRIHAFLQARGPGGLVAELGRTGHAGGVTRRADLFVDLLAHFRRGSCRRGSGGGRCGCCGCRSSRRSGGRSRRGSRGGRFRSCGRGRRGSGGGRRLGELGATGVGQVDHGAGQFVIGVVIRRAAGARRHRALAVEHRLHQAVEALADTRGPVAGGTVLGRTRRAGGVAGGADFLVDLFTGLEHARRVGVLDFEQGDRLDAIVDGFGGGARAGAFGRAVSDEVDQQDDHDDRHQERRDHDCDQLLRGFDGRLVLGVFVVDVAHTELSVLQETFWPLTLGLLFLALVWPFADHYPAPSGPPALPCGPCLTWVCCHLRTSDCLPDRGPIVADNQPPGFDPGRLVAPTARRARFDANSWRL
ncbi:hypothetical protein CBM2634_A300055 [Cupriavidus taiwanensis]|uniref:Uncharacterized protein n=1 Tax=Cupriavidus taiwanensis TaxID=164546 RepID=A0A375J0C7_9BURK|nr:hypothetical protein CBM2634_A300055 [Cupriavidus taiwanensis]